MLSELFRFPSQHGWNNFFDMIAMPGILLIGGVLFAVALMRPGPRRGRLILTVVGTLAALTFYVVIAGVRGAVQKADDIVCLDNLKSLALAAMTYEQATGHLTSAAHWDTDIAKYLPPGETDTAFHCPDATSPYCYAYNVALSNVKLDDIADPEHTVMHLRCDACTRNALRTRQNLIVSRHWRQANFVAADGNAKGAFDPKVNSWDRTYASLVWTLQPVPSQKR